MKRFFLLIFLTVLVQWSIQANNRFASLADTISVSTDSLVHNQCFGESSGKIFLTVQSALPVTFSWSNGDSLQNIDGLPTGYYAVTVSDTTGSEVVLDSIFIAEPSEITIGFVDVVYPNCLGGLGELGVLASGGVPDYSYLWNIGDTLAVVDSLISAMYEVSVTDANGCQAASSFLLQPQNPLASLTSTGNINCLQSTVTLDGTGSLPNSISFEWLAENGGHFSTTTDSLVVEVDSAGTYTLTITDTLTGCSSASFVIVEIDTLVPVVDAGVDSTVVCENTIIGLSGTATNGTSFSYTWIASNGGVILDGESTDSITVGAAGLFTLEVVNLENGCQATDSVAVNATNPAPTATVTDGELNCYFPSINLPIVADTTDKSFTWTGPNNFSSNELSPLVNEEGIYTVQIIDTITTCSANYSIEIIDNQGSLNLIVEGGVLNCNISSVTLGNANTSGDAVYDWTGPNGFVSDEKEPAVSEAGEYILQLTDTLTGCVVIDTAVVSIDTLSPIVVIAQPAVLNCQLPTLNLDATGSTLTNTAFAWTTTDGNIVSDANTANPLIDAPGTYLLTLTDTINGCSATASTTVTGDFTTPIISTVGGSFDCFEGVVQIFGIFDTTGVVFEWTGPNGYSSTIQDPFVNAGGEYILTVVNPANGCAVSDTATVIQIGEVPILMVGVSDTITCTTPSVQLTASAQISTVDWSWASANGFSSTEQNPMTTFGGWHYVVAIETTNGCIALDSVFVVMDTELPLASAGAGLAFDCHTSSTVLNGMASTGPEFSFVWNTLDGNFAEGEDTLTPTVDQAGTYTLTVTDESNGCVSSSDVVITQTAPVTIDVSSTDAACFGGASGTGTVAPSGGVGNYSIAWSSGSTASFAQGLVVGNYSVTVTDGDGCSAVGDIVINQPDLLVANASATGETLAGLNDGTATANPTGGTMPYNYLWSNNETTQSISPLAPGVYKVTVTDDNNCMSFETVNVNEFPCTLTSSISATHVNCFGDSTGTAAVILENATLPFSFVWSNGDTTATISNLPAGTYSVIANDSTLCKNELTVVVNEPTPIQITELFHENVDCQGEENGFVIVGVNGGVQPYSFLWSNGDVTPVSNGLGTGAADLVVTDGNGCEANFSTTIITNDVTAPQLVLQDISVSLDLDGLVALNATAFDAGTTDNCGTFTLLVEPDTFDCSALGSQQVSITAIDESGNVSTGTAFVQIIDDQSPVLICPDNIVASACNALVSFEAPAVQDNCSIDPANLIQTEGPSSSSVFPLGTTTVVFGYTDAGLNSSACSFDVTIVDSMQTEIASSNVTCAAVCNGSIQLEISGGITPYEVAWSNGSATTELSDLCAGSYTVSISDASGCSEIQTLEISEPPVLELAIDTIINNVCANDQSGNIAVTISGGTSPYAQLWSDGSTEVNLENAVSSTYTLVVTDANNCEISISAEINSQDTVAPVVVLQNITVELDSDGLAILDPALFDNGSFDNCTIETWEIAPASFDCSAVGDQQVTITATDSNGNSNSATAMVTIVDKIDPVLVCPDNQVVGFCNALVVFTGPQITDNCAIIPVNLQLVAGMPSGSTFPEGTTTQQFGYIDAAGNSATCSFTITVNASADISAATIDIACNSFCDGEIALTLNGGTAPYVITWSDGQTGPTATDLCAGDYSATIVDADGCEETFSSVLTEPTSLAITVDEVTNDANMDGIGAIQISVSGGVGPYSYNWVKDGQPFSNNEDLSGLSAGTYQIVVVDANGCEIESETIIVENLVPTGEAIRDANAFNLAPNPTKSWTKLIAVDPFLENTTIEMYNFAGKLCQRFTVVKGQSEIRLDLGTIPSGIYTLKFKTNNGLIVKPLVIE